MIEADRAVCVYAGILHPWIPHLCVHVRRSRLHRLKAGGHQHIGYADYNVVYHCLYCSHDLNEFRKCRQYFDESSFLYSVHVANGYVYTNLYEYGAAVRDLDFYCNSDRLYDRCGLRRGEDLPRGCAALRYYSENWFYY